jgi:hypothetical protein
MPSLLWLEGQPAQGSSKAVRFDSPLISQGSFAYTRPGETVSAASSLPLEEILAEKHVIDEKNGKGKEMSMMYQVYIQTERFRTEELVKEAVAGGVQLVNF